MNFTGHLAIFNHSPARLPRSSEKKKFDSSHAHEEMFQCCRSPDDGAGEFEKRWKLATIQEVDSNMNESSMDQMSYIDKLESEMMRNMETVEKEVVEYSSDISEQIVVENKRFRSQRGRRLETKEEKSIDLCDASSVTAFDDGDDSIEGERLDEKELKLLEEHMDVQLITPVKINVLSEEIELRTPNPSSSVEGSGHESSLRVSDQQSTYWIVSKKAAFSFLLLFACFIFYVWWRLIREHSSLDMLQRDSREFATWTTFCLICTFLFVK